MPSERTLVLLALTDEQLVMLDHVLKHVPYRIADILKPVRNDINIAFYNQFVLDEKDEEKDA